MTLYSLRPRLPANLFPDALWHWFISLVREIVQRPKLRSKSILKQEVAEILTDLRRLGDRLEDLLSRLGENLDEDSDSGVGLFALLAIPDHLRKSVLALSAMKEATATEVAEKTGRTRVAESMYLNQLIQMGYLTKTRKGKKVYFALEEDKT